MQNTSTKESPKSHQRLESGIQVPLRETGIQIQRRGIQNPGLFWIPLHGAKIEITLAF